MGRCTSLRFRAGRAKGVYVSKKRDVCAPAFFTAPMPLPAAWQTIPKFRAREVELAPLDVGRSVDAVQGRVRCAAGEMYFKPRVEMREEEFARELDVLLRIEAAGLAGRIRVPKLHGLVVSDEEMVIGMLKTMIGAGTTLRDPEMQARTDMYAKWETQVTEIVEGLHEYGIVWGDVHPMNVVMDDQIDAWAIDFGGMNNIHFVDDVNRETEIGD
jgi:serine/threonine-protein kinase RIO1